MNARPLQDAAPAEPHRAAAGTTTSRPWWISSTRRCRPTRRRSSRAKLNLDYARITSPIDGVTGVRLVDPGNLVHAADTTGIVVVTQLDPIAVLFTLPEDDLPAHRRSSAGRTPLTVEAFSRDGGQAARRRASSALIDNQINQATATIRLKAHLRRTRSTALWPNQFVKARLLLTTRKARSWCRRRSSSAARRDVRVRRQRGSDRRRCGTIEVESHRRATSRSSRAGFTSGEQVVVDGQNQLRPGAEGASRQARTPPTAAAASARRPERAAASSARPRPAAERREHLRAVHPAAGRDDAADGRLCCSRASSRSRSCRSSALPQVDYPTIVVSTILPGAQRRHDGVGGDDAARAPVRADAVAHADDERLELRQLADHAAVRPRPQHRRRRAGRAGGDQRRVEPAAATLPDAADLLEEQPGRHADPHAGASARDVLPLDQVDDFADSILAQKISQVSGVGLVTHQRRAEAGRARAGRSRGARRHRAHARGRAHRARRRERQPAQGQPRRPAPGLHARDQRPARSRPTAFKPLIIAYKNGAPVRLAGRRRRRSTASRTRSSPAGPTTSARSSSTCSASRARTSSRSPTA